MSATLLPSISVSNPGVAACNLKCKPEYQSVTKYMKTCQLHCTTMYQSVTWGIHLECIDLPEYRSATKCTKMFPGVSVSNPGYNALSPGMFLENRSATKYTKTCRLHCSPVYQSVTRDITSCRPECFWNIGQRQSL